MSSGRYQRRAFVALAGAVAIAPLASLATRAQQTVIGGQMYGVIGKINAVPGKRDVLAATLLESTQAMPGCLSYVVATDPAEPDALWITEVWDSQASHQASLSLPAVQAAIAAAEKRLA